MKLSILNYAYSTKNFHRYTCTNAGTINEVYIPRAEMAKPVRTISLTPAVQDATEVPMQAKPVKE